MPAKRAPWRVAFEDAVLAVVREDGPLTTPQVRAHFHPRHYNDVYRALQRCVVRGVCWREHDGMGQVLWGYEPAEAPATLEEP